MWMRRQTKVVSEFRLWRHPFPTCNKKPGSFRSPGFLMKNKIKRSHPAAALTGIGAGAGTGCEFLFLAVKPLYRQTLRILHSTTPSYAPVPTSNLPVSKYC
jgi:hypothetical protein